MHDIPYVEDVTRFWLPIAPTTNNLYANTPQGRRKTQDYRSWLTQAGWRIRVEKVQPIPGKRWALRIQAAVNHRRDLSNCLKATEDLIVEMNLVSDDRYIDRIVLERVPQGEIPYPFGMLVSIWALS